MNAADRAQFDSLRRRIDALAERTAALEGENTLLAEYLHRSLEVQRQQDGRLELLAGAYGKLLVDIRVLRGGHVSIDWPRAADLDRELISQRKIA